MSRINELKTAFIEALELHGLKKENKKMWNDYRDKYEKGTLTDSDLLYIKGFLVGSADYILNDSNYSDKEKVEQMKEVFIDFDSVTGGIGFGRNK